MVSLLSGSIQELNSKFDQLKKENEFLKGSLGTLQKQVDILRNNGNID